MPVEIPELSISAEPQRSLVGQPGGEGSAEITSDLVQKVADRVMALLLLDTKYDRERRRSVGRPDRLKGVR